MNKLIKIIKLPFYEKVDKLKYSLYLLKTQVIYKLFFGSIGKGSVIMKPLRLNNTQNIILKDNVIIRDLTWLLTLKVDEVVPRIIIDSYANLGHFNHITCVNEVYIGKNVLIADKVYISDNYHNFDRFDIPILSQGVKSKGKVYIGENSWIGENVSIISCSIGRNCIIGANSVVNKDIPDYSMAAGVPAKVIKRYNFNTSKWQKINERGEYINE